MSNALVGLLTLRLPSLGWVLSPVFQRAIFTLPSIYILFCHSRASSLKRGSCGIISHGVAERESIRDIHGAQKNLIDSPERFFKRKTLPPCNPHFPNGSLPRKKARGNSSTIQIVCEEQEDSENSANSFPSVALVGRKTESSGKYYLKKDALFQRQ